MEFKGITIGSTLIILIALVLPHTANTTSTPKLRQSKVTPETRQTQWLEVRRPERIDKMHMPPPSPAVLVFKSMTFNPKWDPIAVGLPIGIHVIYRNTGPPGSSTTEFRIYFSRDGKLLEKRKVQTTGGLRGGWSSSTKFQITLPHKPGRYCWEVSFRQTDDGRMTLGEPKKLCALLKTKPTTALPQKRP